MKRAIEFLRSVTPADPSQLVLLAAIVCLVIAHGASWRPAEMIAPSQRPANAFSELLRLVGMLALYLVVFSELAGYFVCFWPGTRPTRRVVAFVWLPTVAALLLMLGRIIYFGAPYSSVFENLTSVATDKIRWGWETASQLSGFQFSFAGLVLTSVFLLRLATKTASLPLSLPGELAHLEDAESWHRLQRMIWFLVSLVFLPGALVSFLSSVVASIFSQDVAAYVYAPWFSIATSIPEAALFAGIALWIAGRDGRRTVWSSIRVPNLRWVFLGLTVPCVIDILISLGLYARDHMQWAAQGVGILEPPHFRSYFFVPNWLTFFGAIEVFAEELIFRGLLQTKLTRRYGLYRGIFLVGIVWAAFHFYWDFSFLASSAPLSLAKLGNRIFLCLSVNLELAWLTLRSRSVIPAVISHTLFNVMVFSPIGPVFAWKSELRLVLWTVAGWILFRYWPARSDTELIDHGEESMQPLTA